MDPKKFGSKRKPESIIQDAIIAKLRNLEWFVKSTHGNMYQSGFPDLYAAHFMYGAKWIEVKNPDGYSFTPAQLEIFPALSAKNIGIWIITGDSDGEIAKLFGPPNWYIYMNMRVTR